MHVYDNWFVISEQFIRFANLILCDPIQIALQQIPPLQR